MRRPGARFGPGCRCRLARFDLAASGADAALTVSADDVDLYTITDRYPYSAPAITSRLNAGEGLPDRFNYIRNSVKVIIDAYNGQVSFYIVDEKDPIVQTYASIFPDLFKPFHDMPADLKRHIRYPRDLFKIQEDIFTTYHMEDVQVFYNQEEIGRASCRERV